VNAAATARVVIVDAGGANFHSVQSAFARLGAKACVSGDRGRIAEATHLVLPGVGAAGAAMAKLREARLDDCIATATQPLLGICLGMQLLFERSEEGGTACLGLLPGTVAATAPLAGAARPAHGLEPAAHARLRCAGRGPGTRSTPISCTGYAAPAIAGDMVAECEHGEPFAALVARGRLCGAQFHPERSARAGARLLRNFLERARIELRHHSRHRHARRADRAPGAGRLRARNYLFRGPAAAGTVVAAQGARWLHLVDLDAARTGGYSLQTLLARLRRIEGLQVQTGGGIRNSGGDR
jgi:glutamine amidotransferase